MANQITLINEIMVLLPALHGFDTFTKMILISISKRKYYTDGGKTTEVITIRSCKGYVVKFRIVEY